MDSNKLLRIKDVSNKTTLAKSTIWRKLSLNQFPKPTKLSPAIYVWRESAIDAWIDSQFVDSKEAGYASDKQ